jgi:3-hydroxybutyryl-CoA dehydrogenase
MGKITMGFPIITPFSVRMGIAGAGTMGSGIALAALLEGIPVRLFDVQSLVLERAESYIRLHLERKGKLANFERLELTTNLEDFSGCNFIIEAVPEDLAMKRELFSRLDELCPPPAVLATNTSTLAVTEIAAGSGSPERVVGMHFFNPAPVMPLVEVVKGAQTVKSVLDTVVAVAKLMGKTPIVARDLPGFIVNRVARPYYGEALRLLGEGAATHAEIDLALHLGAGFRMGPFRLMDLIGIDINTAAMQSMYDQTSGEPRYRPHWIQRQMLQQGALGSKAGRGFYNYKDGRAEDPQPVLPKMGGGRGTVVLAPGTWAPGLDTRLQEAGYTIVTEPDRDRQLVAGVVPAGRRENLASILARWDRMLPTDVPLLCQAADVTMAEAATWMESPERLVGFDGLFFQHSSLITLTLGPEPAPGLKAKVDPFVQSLGKLPLWVADTPALILPRVICMLVTEAAFALMDGVASPEDIDQAMCLGVNYPKGPLAWATDIGSQRVLAVLDHLYTEYREDRYRAAQIMRRWVRLEQLND